MRGSWKLYLKTFFLGETLKTAILMNKNIMFCACKYENIFKQHISPKINNNLTAVNREFFVCLLVITMHVLGFAKHLLNIHQSTFFVNLFHSKNSNLAHCFSDQIYTEYRKLHKITVNYISFCHQ